jgi:hypothetical protein
MDFVYLPEQKKLSIVAVANGQLRCNASSLILDAVLFWLHWLEAGVLPEWSVADNHLKCKDTISEESSNYG